jgi:hypothetical protein
MANPDMLSVLSWATSEANWSSVVGEGLEQVVAA